MNGTTQISVKIFKDMVLYILIGNMDKDLQEPPDYKPCNDTSDDDWGELKLVKIIDENDFWKLYSELEDEKRDKIQHKKSLLSEFKNERIDESQFWQLYSVFEDEPRCFLHNKGTLLSAFKNEELYGLRMNETDWMYKNEARRSSIFCKGSFYLVACFCVLDRDLRKTDRTHESTHNAFVTQSVQLLREFNGDYSEGDECRKSGSDLIDLFEETVMEDHSDEWRSERYPLLRPVIPVPPILPSVCILWTHTRAQRKGFGRKLVEILNIKEAHDVLPESIDFWSNCGFVKMSKCTGYHMEKIPTTGSAPSKQHLDV